MNLGGLAPFQTIKAIKQQWPEIYEAIIDNYIEVIEPVDKNRKKVEETLTKIDAEFYIPTWNDLVEKGKKDKPIELSSFWELKEEKEKVVNKFRSSFEEILDQPPLTPDKVYPIPKEGIKHDFDKPRFTLLVPEFIEEMAKVMAFGAKKYEDWNWLKLEQKRLNDSLARHGFNYLFKGSEIDEETGLEELAHIAVNCMMLSALKRIENAKTS